MEEQIQQKESIKLKKNAKEGMEWEIKLHINEELTEPDKEIIKRLKQLNEDLQKEYGNTK